jgi:hypothetical protein
MNALAIVEKWLFALLFKVKRCLGFRKVLREKEEFYYSAGNYRISRSWANC